MASKKKRTAAKAKSHKTRKPGPGRRVRKPDATRARPATASVKSNVMPSSPRHAWSVDYEIIRNLTETRLVGQLVRTLLLAEAAAVRLDITKILVNSEPKGDMDVMRGRRNPSASPWLGDTDTCWQLKAGQAGEPSRLKGEVAKPEPKKILRPGPVRRGDQFGRDRRAGKTGPLEDSSRRSEATKTTG